MASSSCSDEERRFFLERLQLAIVKAELRGFDTHIWQRNYRAIADGTDKEGLRWWGDGLRLFEAAIYNHKDTQT